MHNYKIRYDLQPETRPQGFTKNDANGKGLTDAYIFISILKLEDGSYSQALITFDGSEERKLFCIEKFKAWMMMGLSLHDEGGVKGWQGECLKNFSEEIRAFIKSMNNVKGLK